MDLEDTTRFVQRLAERGGEEILGIYGLTGRFTKWHFDDDKLNRLSQCLLAEYSSRQREMDALGEAAVNIRRAYCMRLVLLTSLPSLGSGRGIRGMSEDDFPCISLAPGSMLGDVVLQYQTSVPVEVSLASDTNSMVPLGTKLLRQCTLTLTGAQEPGFLTVSLADHLKGDLANELSFGQPDVTSLVLSVVGFTPYVGYAAGAINTTLTATSIYTRFELLDESNEELNNIRWLGGAYGNLDMWGIMTSGTEFDGAASMYLFEGSDTDELLSALNSAVSENGISHTLGNPITYDAVL